MLDTVVQVNVNSFSVGGTYCIDIRTAKNEVCFVQQNSVTTHALDTKSVHCDTVSVCKVHFIFTVQGASMYDYT